MSQYVGLRNYEYVLYVVSKGQKLSTFQWLYHTNGEYVCALDMYQQKEMIVDTKVTNNETEEKHQSAKIYFAFALDKQV